MTVREAVETVMRQAQAAQRTPEEFQRFVDKELPVMINRIGKSLTSADERNEFLDHVNTEITRLA